MARYKFRSPDQPLWLQLVMGAFEFCASLKLAVILVSSAAAVLGWATVVESQYGLRAVHFGIYGTTWFTLLNVMLAINIFCAAASRFPWKRHQTGFVITHIGLLTLMLGTGLSRRFGIDAQMMVWEGSHSHRAYEDSEHFELAVAPLPAAGETSQADYDEEVYPHIGFTGGPFNWKELDEMGRFPRLESPWRGSWIDWRLPLRSVGCVLRWFFFDLPTHLAWAVAPRDPGTIFDHDNIRLEVLDYYSNAAEIHAPHLKLRLSSPRMPRQGAEGRDELSPETWVPVELSVRQSKQEFFGQRPQGIGNRESVGGGGITFWLAGSAAEVHSFLDSKPNLPLGEKGQVVLHAGGGRHVVNVQEKIGQGRFPLGETELAAEVTGYFATAGLGKTGDDGALHFTERAADKPEQPAVEIAIFRGEERLGQLSLLADYPELGQQLGQHEIYGSYWFDHGQKDSAALLAGEGGSRIDIVQAPGGELAYRYWNRHELVAADNLPTDGTRIDAFKMPMAQLQMYVERHVAASEPALKYLPVAFNSDMTAQSALRAAQVRLTVDGKSEEFWLVGPPVTTQEGLVSPNQRRTLTGDGRSVTVTLPLDEIDVGFLVGLNKFERKLDPGTSQASHYSSIVDLLDRDDATKAFQKQVLITMNAPIDFSSPKSGRSYRLFQESFQGPFAPGDPMYDVLVPGSLRAEMKPRAMSILTVNHDPGRGVKYIGSLLIVAGIATMFYMRAYFFKPTGKPAAQKPAKKRKPERPELAAR